MGSKNLLPNHIRCASVCIFLERGPQLPSDSLTGLWLPELKITAPDEFSKKGLSLALLCGLKRAFGVLGSRGVTTVRLRFLVPEKNLIL